MKKKLRTVICLLYTFILITGTAGTASAATVTSSVKYSGTINGYNYKITSSLSDADAFGVCASGTVYNVSGKSPTGWIGINARVMQNGYVKGT